MTSSLPFNPSASTFAPSLPTWTVSMSETAYCEPLPSGIPLNPSVSEKIMSDLTVRVPLGERRYALSRNSMPIF